MLVAFAARPAWADDTADEADLQFELGAQAYQRREYLSALEHFLTSNRLVPNRNVIFNVAKSYEQLRRFPEAFRYYTLALEAEPDPADKARIQAALEQIRPHVAVLEVETQPRGATIYVDRRDLGPRGETPRALGLHPGRYRILVDLPGYYSAELQLPELPAGALHRVSLALQPLLGSIELAAGTAGARAELRDPRVQSGSARPSACLVPCRLEVPPGRHVLVVSKPGFEAETRRVEVAPNQVSRVEAQLATLTGGLVVSTDEPGALVEVSGRPLGFTPAIVQLPVGTHPVRLVRAGYKPIERLVTIASEHETRLHVVLTEAERVTAASRVDEAVETAPSSITIIPRRELRALAYPTLADALRGVRGAFVNDDRAYASVGFRGLGRLGSYGNRVLVLVDGHPLNDNWIGSSYIGYDARADLADLERIEVVRGPGSVVYGTNAFSGVINLVTSQRERPTGTEVGIAAYGDRVARGRVRGDVKLGRDAGLWTSVAGVRAGGRDFVFTEDAEDGTERVLGEARNADGFDAATIQGRAYYRWLSAQWYLNSYDKRLPAGHFETLIGDRRSRQVDRRATVEVRAEPRLSSTLRSLSRAHFNQYRFDGTFARPSDDGGIERDTFRGSWLGVEQRFDWEPLPHLRLTLGGEAQIHYEVEQRAWDETEVLLDDTGAGERPFQVGAAYGSLDAPLTDGLLLSAGVRLDAYSTFGSSLNPRVALIVTPYPEGTLKIMAGKAFRAPSIYELYYNDDGRTQRASPDLDPENIYSLEIEHSHRFAPTVTATAAIFANLVTDLIVSRGEGSPDDLLSFENSGSPLGTVGGELEVRRSFRQGWLLSTSYTYQSTRFLDGVAWDDVAWFRPSGEHRRASNAPEHLLAIKAAAPIVGRQLLLGTRLTVEGPRYDRHELRRDDEVQQRSQTVPLWDIVLSGSEPRWGLDWAVGTYNAFDTRYTLPGSGELRQRFIPQAGRSFLASASVRF